MSNRRIFIKKLFTLGLSTAFSPKMVFSTPIRPLPFKKMIAATTVIAIVQYAVTAAKLFKGNSSDNGLLKLQIRMLENISNQLDVIKQTIDVVSAKVDEVIELVGDMPKEVVQELQSNSIQGYIGQFQSYMDFYRKVGYNPRRFKEIESDIDQLRANINKKVNQMILYDNYLNIPLIVSAMYIEHNCMVFLNHSPEKVSAIMGTYRNYFRKMMYDANSLNLNARIEKIRLDLTSIIKSAAHPVLYQARSWHWGYGWWFMRTGFYSYTITPDLTAYKEKVQELISLGLIEPNELLQTVTINMATKIGDKGFRFTYDEIGGVPAVGGVSVETLPTVADLNAKISSGKVTLENTHRHLTLQLYTAVSCRFAANRALNFCNQFDI